MLNIKNKYPLHDAIRIYGIRRQIDKAIEEMAELIKALMKDRHEERTLPESMSVREEIADVFVVLSELVMIFDRNETEIQKILDFKINRLAERNYQTRKDVKTGEEQ